MGTEPSIDARVAEVLAGLEAAADPAVAAEMGPRFGITAERALGVRMADIKAVARRAGRHHPLAVELWATGIYEARMAATMIADPSSLTPDEMDAWCRDLDSWAIVDTACFNLFDRSPHAWAKVEAWAPQPQEMVRRAGFALLWSLANHDRASPDGAFAPGLALAEAHAADERHLVEKAIAMALKAIGKRRPLLRSDVLEVAARLVERAERPAARIGRDVQRGLR